jgi:hypothetical protein
MVRAMATVCLVGNTVVGLFLIGSGCLLLHVGIKATALNHETVDDAMEDGAVVVAALYVFFKVGGGNRSLVVNSSSTISPKLVVSLIMDSPLLVGLKRGLDAVMPACGWQAEGGVRS